MTFQNFELEYYQSLHEHEVQFNLADSSVKCVNVREWLTDAEIEKLLDTGLFYPEVNGTKGLRDAISTLYGTGCNRDNVLVTVGASQANSLVCATLLEPGDQVVVITPGYRQVAGMARNAGCNVIEVQTREEDGWRLDLDSLSKTVTSKVKLLAVVNPNNPTGAVFSDAEMQRIVQICAEAGCWLHADEVYQGTELEGAPTKSFWGMYERVVCTGSVSKAYGLSGLRIGWALAAPSVVQSLWRRHEYALIAASGPGMTLAEIALQPAKRDLLLARQRDLSHAGRAVMREWLTGQMGRITWRESPATSIAFVRCHMNHSSWETAEQVRKFGSVLVGPGSYLGAEGYLRITVGYDADKVREALRRVGNVLDQMATSAEG